MYHTDIPLLFVARIMARMTIRSTYALDAETSSAIRSLASRWRTSQAEVIRRAVRHMAEQSAAEPEPLSPLAVIHHYRQAPPVRSASETRRLIADQRKQRRAEETARTRAAPSSKRKP
ncbi:hypothetical protein RM530_05820 [Algiphilus sp. W345]|uniref:Ribbon-helix-helix protein CopG domain-containing protein n=1 Tax=Banduia mediterranea TaxID=3075609 RepID=A0ABU2WG81_9GAMM|nr:hypothetical protein [Algiphilus sp. W345]MDT0496881.1 hypothetical protein [Algiphilus sp. W345]